MASVTPATLGSRQQTRPARGAPSLKCGGRAGNGVRNPGNPGQQAANTEALLQAPFMRRLHFRERALAALNYSWPVAPRDPHGLQW
ncbi:hypothetical protein NDU88_010194 [Pleurodeles waltl]|uniref:Uncharacterized protein n=1 Tax=Pleurodeles waltl TaxID=8319 RepID=A0AAV7QTQ0_PLEWA|nr:hypothetical protein NDU88_010194 [Pleurodeles waltl]